MHEKTFRGACTRAGLNPYLCELVSIREHVSWVHTDKVQATAKAEALLAGGVLRVREQVPLEPLRVPINETTLIVGGGSPASRPRSRSPMPVSRSTWSSASRPSAATWPSSTRRSRRSTARLHPDPEDGHGGFAPNITPPGAR
jgi:hypothetical protein